MKWRRQPAAVDTVRARGLLRDRGWAVARVAGGTAAARLAPWEFAESVLGAMPALVERQPLRAVDGGRTFASTRGFVPFHTDSQRHRGAPPDVQVLACVTPARREGSVRLLDTYQLLARLEAEDPALLDALFTLPRRHVFVFGDVYGPTVGLRGGRLAFTHSPRAEPDDDVARRLAPYLDAMDVTEVRPRAGEVVLVDNQRMLHGRTAFTDEGRHIERLLCWTMDELPRPAGWLERARRAHEDWLAIASPTSSSSRELLGCPAPPPGIGARRMAAVTAVLRGTPPGVVAARLGVAEHLLYAWRDEAFRAAERALEAAGDDDGTEARMTLERARERLR